MYFIIKRILDILISLFGIVLLFPVTLIVKFLYIFSGDFNSIFFVQKRVGKDGKIFNLIKFRTMVINAEEVLNDLLKDKKIKYEYEHTYKIKNDPRLTKVGKFLRILSIDEMPQFINVFLGNMSVIGPRPVLSNELKMYKKNKDKILSVKPGLTGFWVINGRNNLSYNGRVKCELYYVEHMSLFFDIKIFFLTIIFVFKRIGVS